MPQDRLSNKSLDFTVGSVISVQVSSQILNQPKLYVLMGVDGTPDPQNYKNTLGQTIIELTLLGD
jgi:hypothetical protein